MVTKSAIEDVKEITLNSVSLEEPPEPPDSGWAWIVVAGGFLTEALLIGFLASVSVYVYVWMEYFDASAAETSLVVSLCSFIMGVMSPVAGASCSKFGARATAIMGGVLTTTGMLISSQATDILFLIFSLGIFTGFGISLSINSVFVSVGMYFNKRLKLAFGLAATGVGIGQLVFPPLYNYLIDQYGWRGSMMIVAAMTFHSVAAGALIRPLKTRQIKGSTNNKQLSTKSDDTKLEITNLEDFNNNVGKDEIGTDDHSNSNSCSNNFVLSSRETPLADGSILKEDTDEVSMTTSDVQGDNKNDSHSLVSSLEIGFSAMENRYWNTFVITKLEHSVEERVENAAQESFTQIPKSVPLCTRIRIHLRKTLTLINKYFCLSSLLCNRMFVIEMMASALQGYGWASTTYHTVARAESVGIGTDASALLLTFVGVGSLIGRINIGWIMDKNFLRVEFSYCLALFICSLATYVIPIVVAYWLLAVMYVIQGMSGGAAMVAIMLLSRMFVKPAETTAATALVLLAWGIGEITGGFMAGYFYDSLGSYDYSFYAAGSTMAIAALLTLFVYFLQRTTEEICHSASDDKLDFVEAGLDNKFDAKHTNAGFEDGGADNPIFFTTEHLDLGNLEYGNETSRRVLSDCEHISEDNECKHLKSYHANIMPKEEVTKVEIVCEHIDLSEDKECKHLKSYHGNIMPEEEVTKVEIVCEHIDLSEDNECKHLKSYHGNIMHEEEVTKGEIVCSKDSYNDSEELANKTMCVKEVTVQMCSESAFADDRSFHDEYERISDNIINSTHSNPELEIENDSDDTMSTNISHESNCSQDLCFYGKDLSQSSTKSFSELSEDSGIDNLMFSPDSPKERHSIESAI